MASLAVNQTITQRRVTGSLESYAMQVLNNAGSAVDITSLAMTFSMVNIADGTSAISAAGATIDSGSLGNVSYTFSSAHAEGVYAVYFESSVSRWPYDAAKRRIEFVSDIE